MTMTAARQISLWPYVQIARIDHWFKNAFMLLGVALAFFYESEFITLGHLPLLVGAFFATCVIASSNYVLNEWLDAPLDALHPTKCNRPAAQGLISGPVAIAEWLGLAGLGLGMAFSINTSFGYSGLALWIMGCVYNIPPVRAKDLPYVDVISESVNNPIRLLLGWFALIPDLWPPLSLAVAYWMAGAFFMATKRFAEYRHIGDAKLAADYRRSFAHYDEERLLGSMVFYLSVCALFSGVFIVRYKLELILCAPLVATFFSYYVMLGLRPNSPVQSPEKLYRERRFFALAIATAACFVLLMFTDVPVLYEWFNCDPSNFRPLWSIGGGG
jgi:4-hydroxybenzoate polyprenyltransferase